MGLTFEPLGKYVRLVDERNTGLVTESVLGINIDKHFMPSVANVIGTDLENYKLLRKGRFACNPMHVGRDGRLPVARYIENAPAIVSPAYFMFEIIDENEIEPEYLMLCFQRPDFDRMCWFRTDASVRGGITWDDVCALTIPVIPLIDQRKVVQDYYVITNRIALMHQLNDSLEKIGETAYMGLFEKQAEDLPSNWHMHQLSEYLPIITGKKDVNTTCENGCYPFFSCSQDCLWTNDYSFDTDAILVAGNGDFNVKYYSGRFEAYQRTYVLVPYKKRLVGWLYYVIKRSLPKATTAARGSVISFITKGILENISFPVPDNPDVLFSFCDKANTILKQIRTNNDEIQELEKLRQVLLNNMCQRGA